MLFHLEQLQIIKDLFLSYQKTPDEETFYQILKRVDRMLTEVVVKFSKIYFFNASVQDLYQTAIVGLWQAVKHFNPTYKETAIPKCILFRVRKEMFSTYGKKKFNTSQYMYEHPFYPEKMDINFNLIQEDVQKIIEEAINSEKISEEDLHLIVLIYIENIPISEIFRIFGDRWGKSYTTINKKVEKISRILRKEFEKSGFGNN